MGVIIGVHTIVKESGKMVYQRVASTAFKATELNLNTPNGTDSEIPSNRGKIDVT